MKSPLVNNSPHENHKVSFTDVRFFSRVKRFFGFKKKEFIPNGLPGKYRSLDLSKGIEREIDKITTSCEQGESSRTENNSLSSISSNYVP